MTSTIAIIPARGGSKGIPRKNVRMLAGKPLLAWTVETAQAAGQIDRIVVSTDDEEIGTVARRYGAEVVWRPAALATDEASSESALLHALQFLEEEEGYQPDAICFLQCTSPLTTAADIEGTMALVVDDGFDSAVTMTPFHYFLWRDTEQGEMVGINHEATRRLRRQERETEYQEVGAVYAMRAEGFREHRFRFFGRIGKYLLPSVRAFEIDDPVDWPVAEALMVASGRAVGSFLPRPRQLAAIEIVVTDFDGVMTDNRAWVNEEGLEAVTVNRGDGWGIELLRAEGFLVACISTETNPVVAARCRKLGIPYWQGQTDKLSALQRYLSENGVAPEACLYVGNDTNDTDCMAYVGLAVAPADAAPEAKAEAQWVTAAAGGEGVVREIARHLLAAQETA